MLQRQIRLSAAADRHSNRFVFEICSISVCLCSITEPYRGRGRQDDVSNGGFKLVDGGSVLMRAVVWLNGLDFYVELPGFIFVLGVTGRVEGILFGM